MGEGTGGLAYRRVLFGCGGRGGGRGHRRELARARRAAGEVRRGAHSREGGGGTPSTLRCFTWSSSPCCASRPRASVQRLSRRPAPPLRWCVPPSDAFPFLRRRARVCLRSGAAAGSALPLAQYRRAIPHGRQLQPPPHPPPQPFQAPLTRPNRPRPPSYDSSPRPPSYDSSPSRLTPFLPPSAPPSTRPPSTSAPSTAPPCAWASSRPGGTLRPSPPSSPPAGPPSRRSTCRTATCS
jgi:hypothetical protein